ncbi:MAG: hypothetical protein IJA65_03160 [Acholeplasmatales bacterium]|nr:hypothetical protein [Acholeplasmatales bacterium]
MKKLTILIFIFIFCIFPLMTVDVYANSEYQTYVEIIMTSGKLLKDFTKEEKKAILKEAEGVYFYKNKIIQVNTEIPATYISNTLFSVDNTSATDLEYNVSVSIETKNKISFSTSGSLSASGKGTIKAIKADVSGKAGIEYSKSSEESVKETKTMNIVVEGNSRAIIYLTGEITVSNGMIVIYRFFMKMYSGGYEFVTLKSQYARIEKVGI